MRYRFVNGRCAFSASKNGKTIMGVADSFDEAWDRCSKLYV